MNFLEKLVKYREGLSYTQYRFNKASNFLTFDEYCDEVVRKYAESLINQPTLHAVIDREDKNVTWPEVAEMINEKVHDGIEIITRDGRSWGLPPYAINEWLKYNNFTPTDIIEMKLNRKK